MKQSPKLPAEKRRAQLIRAAERLFRKNGYRGTSIDQIARAARVTKGAVYFHFDSKEDLFFEVIRDHWTTKLAPLIEVIEITEEPGKLFEKTIAFGFDMIKNERYSTLPFWEQAMKIPRIRNYWQAEHKKIVDALAHKASERTRLTFDESAALIRILSAVLDGMILQKQMCKDNMDLAVQEAELNKIVQTYLKG
jgi:AcrR family transcriptional regulator